MAIKDIFKVSRKTFFNPGAWIGTTELKGYNRLLANELKTVFTEDKTPVRSESFEEAMQRLKLTEQDVQKSLEMYTLFMWIFIAIGCLATLGGIYYVWQHGSFAALILSIATAALLFTQAFRYSFLAFQIRERKLGCTFQEWRQGHANGKGMQS